MYDSSFCLYFNGENIYERQSQHKLVSIPLKGLKRQKWGNSTPYALGPNQWNFVLEITLISNIEIYMSYLGVH